MAGRPEPGQPLARKGDRIRVRVGLAAGLALAVLCTDAALARTYRWVDDKGVVHYSDQLPPEIVNRGSEELSKQGVTIRKVEPALTPEQRRALEEEKARQRERARAEEEQRRLDRLLLDTYRDEQDILRAQRRALVPVGRAILDAEARIAEIGRERAKLDKEKLFYERRPLPDSLKRSFARLDELELERRNFIDAKNREALAVIERFEAERDRFRVLQKAQPAQASRRSP